MELLQLKYFYDAAQTQNLSKTAQKYKVPTSSISQTIRRLEDELQIKLFEHNSNRIVLNEYGKIFSEGVKKAFDALSEATTIINDSSDLTLGEIKICACTNRRIVSETIEVFCKTYPYVTLLLEHNTNHGDDFDIIITNDVLSEDKYQRRELINERILLAVEKHNTLLNKENLQIKDFTYENFISMQENSDLYKLTNNICRSVGFIPNITICSDDPYYVRKYVEMGIGVAFVPSKSWQGQFGENIELLDISSFSRTSYIYWKKKNI